MSLAILFHFLCAQHVSDINISIIKSLWLFCWITTLVVLFLVRCVLEFRCGWVGVVSVLQASACNTDTTPKLCNSLLRWNGGGGGRNYTKIPKLLIRKYSDLQHTLSKHKLEILPVLIDPIITFYFSNDSLKCRQRFYSLQQISVSGRDDFQIWNSRMPYEMATSRPFVV